MWHWTNQTDHTELKGNRSVRLERLMGSAVYTSRLKRPKERESSFARVHYKCSVKIYFLQLLFCLLWFLSTMIRLCLSSHHLFMCIINVLRRSLCSLPYHLFTSIMNFLRRFLCSSSYLFTCEDSFVHLIICSRSLWFFYEDAFVHLIICSRLSWIFYENSLAHHLIICSRVSIMFSFFLCHIPCT